MNQRQIEVLLKKGLFMGKPEETSLIETHISWVILAGEYAYKIKKPLKLSFLDFTSVEDRKKYCKEEVKLNQRLSAEIYLDVQPILKSDTGFQVGGKGNAIDYAVRMRRMNPAKLMSLQLKKKKVEPSFVMSLANIVSAFHKNQSPILRKYDPYFLSKEFADITGIAGKAKKIMGDQWYEHIKSSISLSDRFVNAHEVFIRYRAASGNIRDCHGDLHTQNIFAYETPVVFDCVEFRKEFREIDVLNDIAFLCMDLEAMKRQDLSDVFFKTYARKMKLSKKDPELAALFIYFKAYRACIRAKVNTIALVQHPEDKKAKAQVKLYSQLMHRYLVSIT